MGLTATATISGHTLPAGRRAHTKSQPRRAADKFTLSRAEGSADEPARPLLSRLSYPVI
ncbi:unnamed protein product [marine sediment metagenome]|uniref:Uncharacterized protein n=1 Tax=marine sediment metagenome TaxID=412755 RepID=X1JZ00_9ZZZZ